MNIFTRLLNWLKNLFASKKAVEAPVRAPALPENTTTQPPQPPKNTNVPVEVVLVEPESSPEPDPAAELNIKGDGMEILLSRLPPMEGIYDGKLPDRGHYLYPEAARSLMKIEKDSGGLIYTSIWRTANDSLWAISNKKGALPPGYSAHNYGLAVDLTIDTIEKRKGWSYTDILEFMEAHGWYCHRRDGKKGFENWHFNYFGPYWDYYKGVINPNNSATWHLAVENQLLELYRNQFDLTPVQIQTALKTMKFYTGVLDGDLGARSIEALNSFQRAYKLRETKQPTARDMRTLAFCTATKRLVRIPDAEEPIS